MSSAKSTERLRALVERRAHGLRLDAVPIVVGPGVNAGSAPEERNGLRLIGGVLIGTEVIDRASDRATDLVEEFHRNHRADPGIPLETLRRGLRLPAELADAAIASAAAAGRLVQEGGTVRRSGFEARVAGGEAELQRLVQILQTAGLTPPSVAELERETGRRDVAAALRLAAGRGLVEAVERDRYYATEALQKFSEAVREIGRAGDIQPATVRERLGISRKYLIPLLEWADARGITVRAGDIRRLAREQN